MNLTIHQPTRGRQCSRAVVAAWCTEAFFDGIPKDRARADPGHSQTVLRLEQHRSNYPTASIGFLMRPARHLAVDTNVRAASAGTDDVIPLRQWRWVIPVMSTTRATPANAATYKASKECVCRMMPTAAPMTPLARPGWILRAMNAAGN